MPEGARRQIPEGGNLTAPLGISRLAPFVIRAPFVICAPFVISRFQGFVRCLSV